MTDVAKRCAGPIALGTVATTVYTVPAATTTVIRSLHVANESAAAATFTVSIGVDAAGKRVFYNTNVGIADAYDWTGNIVLATGEVVQAYASIGTALTLVVSGIETS